MMEGYRDKINKIREESRASDLRVKRFIEATIDESVCQKRLFNEKVLPALHHASLRDYTTWLYGYLSIEGNEATHSYNRNMPTDCLYTAHEDFVIVPVYGSSSVDIIVPYGVKFLGGKRGHCNLYFMDGFKLLGGFVPVYSDV